MKWVLHFGASAPDYFEYQDFETIVEKTVSIPKKEIASFVEEEMAG